MREWQELGFLAAESDRELEEVFIETREFRSAEDLDDPRCILLGRTGSGKSAILRALTKKYSNSSEYIVVNIHPGATYLDEMVRGLDDGGLDGQSHVIAYKLAWHYVIMTRVLRARFPNGPNGIILRGEKLKAYRFLEKADQLTRDEKTITDVFLSIFEEIKVGFFSGKIANPAISLMKETEKFFDNGFWEVVGGAKLFVLFDDLDLAWDANSPQQQKLLRALFDVIQQYNHRERVKPVVALRDDILVSLAAVQREKVRDYVLNIRWTSSNLRELLAKRVNHYYQVRPELLEKEFFQNNLSGEEPISYILNRTANRPRDLIEFVNFAIEEARTSGDKYIFPRDIHSAEPKYAVSRLSALEEEWKWVYPNLRLVFNGLVECWGTIDEEKSPPEFAEVLKLLAVIADSSEPVVWILSHYNEKDPTDLANLFCRLGLIKRNDITSVEWDREIPPVNKKKTRFELHPMYHAASGGRDPSVWA